MEHVTVQQNQNGTRCGLVEMNPNTLCPRVGLAEAIRLMELNGLMGISMANSMTVNESMSPMVSEADFNHGAHW